MAGRYGDSTRSLKATDVQAISGQPVAPQAVLAATYHLSGDETGALDSYGRSSNPTWRRLESALAELEGAGGALVFGSGMADGFARISLGIEDTDDLLADIERALMGSG